MSKKAKPVGNGPGEPHDFQGVFSSIDGSPFSKESESKVLRVLVAIQGPAGRPLYDPKNHCLILENLPESVLVNSLLRLRPEATKDSTVALTALVNIALLSTGELRLLGEAHPDLLRPYSTISRNWPVIESRSPDIQKRAKKALKQIRMGAVGEIDKHWTRSRTVAFALLALISLIRVSRIRCSPTLKRKLCGLERLKPYTVEPHTVDEWLRESKELLLFLTKKKPQKDSYLMEMAGNEARNTNPENPESGIAQSKAQLRVLEALRKPIRSLSETYYFTWLEDHPEELDTLLWCLSEFKELRPENYNYDPKCSPFESLGWLVFVLRPRPSKKYAKGLRERKELGTWLNYANQVTGRNKTKQPRSNQKRSV